MWNDAQIREALNEMLIDVLGVEDDELVPDARFFEDLGGESIDMLELTFQAERKFGCKVEFQKMVAMDELELDSNRNLTECSIEKVRQALPFIDVDELRRDPRIDAITRLLTVENLYQYLRRALRGGAKNVSSANN